MIKLTRLDFKWAVVFTIANLCWNWFEMHKGWHDVKIDQHAAYTLLFSLPAFIIYLMAIKSKRKKLFLNTMTWKQGFQAGVAFTLAVAILVPVSNLVTCTMISPDFLHNLSVYNVKYWGISQGQANFRFSLAGYIIENILRTVVAGSCISAVLAIFLQRK